MAKAATATAEVQIQEEFWTVVDTLVEDPSKPRTHTLYLDGVKTDFTFHRQAELKMPAEAARKFLIDAAFIVRDVEGNRVRPLDATEKTTDKTIKLQPGQVIATFDDLTKEALLRRTSHLIGGEKFNARSSRDDLIAFLTEQTAAVEKVNSVEDRRSDELNDRDLDKLMGPKAA